MQKNSPIVISSYRKFELRINSAVRGTGFAGGKVAVSVAPSRFRFRSSGLLTDQPRTNILLHGRMFSL